MVKHFDIKQEKEMSKNFNLIMVLFLCSLLLASCKPKADLPNPASVYCEENGGTLEIRTDESGGQTGVCLFPDGSECEEWEFYRGDCQSGDSLSEDVGLPNPASLHCEENNGILEIREDETGGQVGICVFLDGSECDEWALFRGECQPGDN